MKATTGSLRTWYKKIPLSAWEPAQVSLCERVRACVCAETHIKWAGFTGQSIRSHHFAFLTAQCTSVPCHVKHRFSVAEDSNILMFCFSSREEVRRQHGGPPRCCVAGTHCSCTFRQTSWSPALMPLTCSAKLLQQLKRKQFPAASQTKLMAPGPRPSLQEKLLILFIITSLEAEGTYLFRPDYVTSYIPGYYLL